MAEISIKLKIIKSTVRFSLWSLWKEILMERYKWNTLEQQCVHLCSTLETYPLAVKASKISVLKPYLGAGI